MRSNQDRVPWQDSVPEKIVESLEPFLARLEQTYSPIANPFELSLPMQRNLFNSRTE